MATLAATAMRQHERYPVCLEVNYQGRDAFCANCVSNLSRGGMFIVTEDPLPVRSELDLTLVLLGQAGSIHARGRVVWNYDIRRGTLHVVHGMGIKFIDLSPFDHQRLAELLASLRARSC